MKKMILVVVILVFVSAVTIYALIGQFNKSSWRDIEKQLEAMGPDPMYYSSYATLYSTMDGFGSVAHIKGTVRNTGDKPIRYVKLKASLTDREGNVRDVTHLYAVDSDPLLPGERKAFDAYLDGFVSTNYNRYTVEVVYLELL